MDPDPERMFSTDPDPDTVGQFCTDPTGSEALQKTSGATVTAEGDELRVIGTSGGGFAADRSSEKRRRRWL